MDFIKNIEWQLIYTVVFRAFLAVIVGALIGTERAQHGRAAGRRTHILVCLGAMLTSLTGIYAIECLGNQGDMLRLSAQVVSGVGFLGAGYWYCNRLRFLRRRCGGYNPIPCGDYLFCKA